MTRCRGCSGSRRRVCANHLRSRRRAAALTQRLAVHPQPAAEAVHEDLGLARALAGLGDRDREAVLLVSWDGLSNREAASVMGCSAATFGVRLHRAKARLAAALTAERAPAADPPATRGMATSDVH